MTYGISYTSVNIFITLCWILSRVLVCRRWGTVSLKREVRLLPVYICIMVVARFTLFPFSRNNGRVMPLVFDLAKAFPPKMNLLPLVNLLNYEYLWEAKLNVIGNIAMFVPIGIIWPMAFKALDSHKKVLAAGAGFSLCIEILQLPFYERHSDVDDLILNTLGYALGYGLYLLVKYIAKKCKKEAS